MNEPSKDGLRLQEMARILKEIQPDRTLLGSISEFYPRSLVARAIAFDFEPMSEIASRLSPSFFEEYPSFPLSEIKGFRNVLVHDYGSLDLSTLKQTLYSSVDSLLLFVESALIDEKNK